MNVRVRHVCVRVGISRELLHGAGLQSSFPSLKDRYPCALKRLLVNGVANSTRTEKNVQNCHIITVQSVAKQNEYASVLFW